MGTSRDVSLPETDRVDTLHLAYQIIIKLVSRIASCRSETLFYSRWPIRGRGINGNSGSSPKGWA